MRLPAHRLSFCQLNVVPGILQTPEYASGILRGNEARINNRIARQAILTRETPPPPRLTALLHEQVLYHRIGTSEIMTGQLRHLITSVSEQNNIQIVPNGLKRPKVTGSFVVATLDSRREIAYLKTALRSSTIGDPSDVQELADAFESIRAQAYPVEMSLDLITKAIEEQWT